MPPTEQCALGAENKANIEGLEKSFIDFRQEIRDDVDEIRKCIVKITNHYSKKPSWAILLTITALTNTLTGLIIYLITR